MALTPQERILLLGALGSPELTKSICDVIDASGVGDIVGPSSATTNDVVRFDGTTGKLVKAGLAYASANTASTLVQRDSSGNFTAGTITATLTGTATNFSGSLVGDVTGTQGATALAASTVTGKLLTGHVAAAGLISASDSILTAFNKLAAPYGAGVTHATPAEVYFNATSGVGTNIAGADLTIAAGRGTGSGTPGKVILATSSTLDSGSTLQTLTDRLRIDSAGNVLIYSGNLALHTGGATFSGDAAGVAFVGAGSQADASMFGGDSGGGEAAGNILISGGNAMSDTATGGVAEVVGGNTVNGAAGYAGLFGGDAGGSGAGGDIYIRAGDSDSDTGGSIELTAGEGNTDGRIFMSTNAIERLSISNAGATTVKNGYLELTSVTDPGAPTDAVRMATKASTAGTPAHTIHLRTEAPVETGVDVASTDKIRVWINGVEYYILLTAV